MTEPAVQDTTLDSYLTGERNLRFHADLYGAQKQQLAPRLKQVLEMVNLWDRRQSVVSAYSGVLAMSVLFTALFSAASPSPGRRMHPTIPFCFSP